MRGRLATLESELEALQRAMTGRMEEISSMEKVGALPLLRSVCVEACRCPHACTRETGGLGAIRVLLCANHGFRSVQPRRVCAIEASFLNERKTPALLRLMPIICRRSLV